MIVVMTTVGLDCCPEMNNAPTFSWLLSFLTNTQLKKNLPVLGPETKESPALPLKALPHQHPSVKLPHSHILTPQECTISQRHDPLLLWIVGGECFTLCGHKPSVIFQLRSTSWWETDSCLKRGELYKPLQSWLDEKQSDKLEVAANKKATSKDASESTT